MAALPYAFTFTAPADFQYVGTDERPVEEAGALLRSGGLRPLWPCAAAAASRNMLLLLPPKAARVLRGQGAADAASPRPSPPPPARPALRPAGLEAQQSLNPPGFQPQPLLCPPPIFAKQPTFDYGFRRGAGRAALLHALQGLHALLLGQAAPNPACAPARPPPAAGATWRRRRRPAAAAPVLASPAARRREERQE